MTTHSTADEAAIREQAYLFWEQDGKPEGRANEYWMRAVVALSDKSQMDTLTQKPPKKAKAEAPVKTAASKTKAAPSKAAKTLAKPAGKTAAKPKKK